MAETKPNVANDGNNSHEKTYKGNMVYPKNTIYIWDDKPTTVGRKKKKKKKKH